MVMILFMISKAKIVQLLLLGALLSIAKFFLPKSIKHNIKEYIITCIKEGSFENSNMITTIQFP